MLGMYGMYFLVQRLRPAVSGSRRRSASLLVAVLGVLLHFLVIAPLLGAAPINQLLATGGVLFLLQCAATVVFGIEFRNLGIRLPVLKLGRDVLQLLAPARLRRGADRHGASSTSS